MHEGGDADLNMTIQDIKKKAVATGEAPPKKPKQRRARVFTDKIKDICEIACEVWGILLQHQSYRDIPRTHFKAGALSTEKINAHEYEGLVLLYLILLNSTVGEFLFMDPATADEKADGVVYKRLGHIGNDRVNNWITALENLLLCKAFMDSHTITSGELDLFQEYMPRFLDLLCEACARTEGANMDLPKTHGKLHTADDIRNWGPLPGCDSQAGEKNHIYTAKQQYHKTQKRTDTTDEQISKNYAETVAIDGAYISLINTICPVRKMDRWRGGFKSFRGCSSYFLGNSKESGRPAGIYKFANGKAKGDQVKESVDSDDEIVYKPTGVLAKWGGVQLQKDVTKFLANTFGNWWADDHNREVTLWNSYHPKDKEGSQFYRASPGKPTQRGWKEGWNDWALLNVLVDLDSDSEGDDVEYELYPAHLLCFVKIGKQEGSRGKTIRDSNGGIIPPEGGEYVVCHRSMSKRKDNDLINEFGRILHRVTKQFDQKKDVSLASTNLIHYLYPVESISAPCICVPDVMPAETSGKDVQYQKSKQDYKLSRNLWWNRVEFMLVADPKTWKDIYVEKMATEKEAHYAGRPMSEVIKARVAQRKEFKLVLVATREADELRKKDDQEEMEKKEKKEEAAAADKQNNARRKRGRGK